MKRNEISKEQEPESSTGEKIFWCSVCTKVILQGFDKKFSIKKRNI